MQTDIRDAGNQIWVLQKDRTWALCTLKYENLAKMKSYIVILKVMETLHPQKVKIERRK